VNRFAWPLLLFAAIVAVLVVGLKHAPDKGIIASPLIGKSAPAFVAPNLLDSGKTVSGVALRGGWHLFNVWGTWCAECRAEHPTLLAIQREARVPVIGLDWKDEDAAAMSWLAELGNPYREVGIDHDGRIAIDWGVYGAPESFLVNPEGVIVEKHVGAMTAAIWHDKFLSRLDAATGKNP
jgi:cytochrome c biogenesis protein CcmG, thiol:disulfide interchange protein DsbE